MSKLVIYGDSFASPMGDFSWANLLAKKLTIPIINKAISGSSIEKSMLLFTEDYKNNFFTNYDVVIFVFSIPGRLHLEYQNKYPHTASSFSRDNDIDNYWYQLNKKYIKWYLLNRDPDLYRLNLEGYLQILKNFTENNSKIKLLLLSVNDLYPIFNLKPSYNFIIPQISLWKISENEFDGITYEQWIEFSKRDCRINHLSLPNLKILVDLVFTSLKDSDGSILNYNKFVTKIFNKKLDKSSIIEYANKGYINV